MPNNSMIPGAPQGLMDRIHARAARIPPGLMMMAEDASEVDGADDAGKGDDFKSEHSKQAVLADLAKEREERKTLQKQVEELAPLRQ